MLLDLITSEDASVRDQPLESACASLDKKSLLQECSQLDQFRRKSENLYDRVRALFFLAAIHRYHLPKKLSGEATGSIPFSGYEDLLGRRFEKAIDTFGRTTSVQWVEIRVERRRSRDRCCVWIAKQ